MKIKIKSALFWIVFLIVLLTFAPFLSIWSINTLFGTMIPYTWQTWLAMVWIGVWFSGSVKKG
jgi:hypothetical protein